MWHKDGRNIGYWFLYRGAWRTDVSDDSVWFENNPRGKNTAEIRVLGIVFCTRKLGVEMSGLSYYTAVAGLSGGAGQPE